MEPRIIEAIKEMGISVDKAAEIAGTNRQQLYNLQRGDRRFTSSWINRLSKAWGCPPDSLYYSHSISDSVHNAITTVAVKVMADHNIDIEHNVDELIQYIDALREEARAHIKTGEKFTLTYPYAERVFRETLPEHAQKPDTSAIKVRHEGAESCT